MNRTSYFPAAAALLAFVLSLATAPLLDAQSTAAAPTPAQLAKYDNNKDGKLDAGELAVLRADEAKAAAKEETITLSIFEVKDDPRDTYEANNTSFVTGTNTALNKTPLDAKVFNRQMLDDMGTVDMTDMLWKLGGLGPAVINAGEDVRGMVEGDRQDPKSMSMRGLQINNPRRDGFLRSGGQAESCRVLRAKPARHDDVLQPAVLRFPPQSQTRPSRTGPIRKPSRKPASSQQVRAQPWDCERSSRLPAGYWPR